MAADDPKGHDLLFLSLVRLICSLHANIQLPPVSLWKQEEKMLMVCACVSSIRLCKEVCCIHVEKKRVLPF